MEIKIGPKPDPCGMPLVTWVVNPRTRQQSNVPKFILFHGQNPSVINPDKQISHWASKSKSQKRPEHEWWTDGEGKAKQL